MSHEPHPAWSVEDAPCEGDLAVVQNGVLEWGRAQAAGGNARPIACFLRNAGGVIAGATGRIEFNRLFVLYLWVSGPNRRQGLGTAALQRLETEACSRGAADALIETFDEEVAGLYRRLGYEAIAVIPNYVGSFNKHVLVKRL